MILATSAMACTAPETQIVTLDDTPDSLAVRGQTENIVLKNPDTTYTPPDTVIVTKVDTLITSPDSILVESVDTVEVTRVDTVVVGTDTAFVPRIDTLFVTRLDTLVTVDTLVEIRVDTVISVDTVVVADTVFVQTTLVAAASSQAISGGLTIDSGATARLTVTTQSLLDIPSVPDMVTWLSDAPGTASVTGDGVVRGVRPGTANIFAIADGLSSTIPTTVRRVQSAPPPEPLPQGSQSRFFRAHEPAGMRMQTSRAMDRLIEPGWSFDFERLETLVSDSGEPHSPSSAIQFNYPEGQTAGRGALNHSVKFFDQPYERVYLYFTVKYDPIFVGQFAGSKIFYLGAANPPTGPGWNTYGLVRGTTGTLDFHVAGQNHAVEPYLFYRANQGSGALTRNQWYEVEILFVANTPGVRNGVLRVWKNGALIHDYSNVGYLNDGYGRGFGKFEFDAIWGGIGGAVPHDQWIRIGHTYISGGN